MNTANWYCPLCEQWFSTALLPGEARIHARDRVRFEHLTGAVAARHTLPTAAGNLTEQQPRIADATALPAAASISKP